MERNTGPISSCSLSHTYIHTYIYMYIYVQMERNIGPISSFSLSLFLKWRWDEASHAQLCGARLFQVCMCICIYIYA